MDENEDRMDLSKGACFVALSTTALEVDIVNHR
jgi:hypothetical protein